MFLTLTGTGICICTVLAVRYSSAYICECRIVRILRTKEGQPPTKICCQICPLPIPLDGNFFNSQFAIHPKVGVRQCNPRTRTGTQANYTHSALVHDGRVVFLWKLLPPFPHYQHGWKMDFPPISILCRSQLRQHQSRSMTIQYYSTVNWLRTQRS